MSTSFVAPSHHQVEPGLIHLEISSAFQIPGFHIVGLPSREVAESKERIRSAIESCGFEFPKRRVVMNLSPADLPKHGTGLDLGMALSILCHERGRSKSTSNHGPLTLAWGELALDGKIRSAGKICRTLWAAVNHQLELLILAEVDRPALDWAFFQISKIKKIPLPILFANSLADAWQQLEAGIPPPYRPNSSVNYSKSDTSIPLLPLAPPLERTLALSASGKHHVLLLGPRGSGKSHALEWLQQLLPRPSAEIELQHTLLNELRSPPLSNSAQPWIRRVGPQARPAALIGGVHQGMLQPGEFSMAHGGLLIADEFPEWPRDSRESLREPMERRKVLITRRQCSAELPSHFTLAATGNFCPCGGWPTHLPPPEDREMTRCRCARAERDRYLSRLSGPLLDRVDLIYWDYSTPDRGNRHTGQTLTLLQEKICVTQALCRSRWGELPGEIPSPTLEARLGESMPASQLELLFKDPILARAPSLRGRHKLLRIAMTLSAWEQSSTVTAEHLMEATCLRLDPLTIK